MWKTQPRYKSSNNIAYYREGSGVSLLFIHGVGLRLESWSAQLKYLKHHFDVIAIDLPGHGESDHQTSNNINIGFAASALAISTLLLSPPERFIPRELLT